ncbi:molecular chaperone HtpG [Sinorhizobium meliloti]|uniref:Chaperone protein HtpG n=1 Tax=Rhizobium meliloti (strain 1021) TaxID=266834 RepID=HTPG_RHIME|nr:molecular chaperone HtpG [Sinorhizobium meliloti]P58477.1 RecName: Full=Chaperone protein HtpG; AltName: Full=Heat shock protein HtpG; AltName: Full=High temperature protein G [Sinorhizobium meliloti 1021]AGG71859.1 putative chaperonine,heat shock hsp90 proteins family [Sinorhizobium meliloti 2011]ASP63080.1 molecular chaperone HtpG [Sinorhizobium meliloti]MCK3805057.1 molecular chaperone HtpG [Sinorhizobium meliloti]MCK3811064.1 molecular chaperone HtpG [Sinorhizobium meliloti]MCK3816102.
MSEVETSVEKHVFEADVAKLLHLMVHSVYSDKNVFLRELISNAADACEKLRYEAIVAPELLGSDPASRITLTLDEENARLVIEDNGIGMGRDELVESLGTIARSGTRAFMERIEAAQNKDGAQLIGQFGVGFYSAFMVADNVDVVSRRAGTDKAWHWASDGKGSYTVSAVDLADAPARGTRITLHLMDEAKTFTSRWTVERIVKEQSGHVPVPISIVEKPGAEPAQVADGTALWTKQKSEISKDDYTDFYRGVAGQYDEPALTVHFRAEGRHEYTALAFVPGSKPFDLFDPDRKGRMKLYVKRVFITDEAELLPRYLRFVRGLVDTADLPLNVSREMIQESPLLANIRKGLTNRVLTSIEKLAESDSEAFAKIWENFGSVIKEGIYEDFERRGQLLALSRFRTTADDDKPRALSDYVKEMKEGQSAIYYLTGDNLAQLKASPQLEGFRARGIEVLLLTCPVDSFWVTTAPDFDGKPFKSITQGAADLAGIAKNDDAAAASPEAGAAVTDFVSFARETLGEAVSDVRTSDRLTESAVCLVAPEQGPDRQLQKMLQDAGRIEGAPKPVLEINPGHQLIAALATCPSEDKAFREDAVKLLLDQARVLDGDRPEDPRAFAERLSRVFGRALKE